MSVEIYARWRGQSYAEEQALYRCDPLQEGSGCLRERAQDGLAATRHLLREAFDNVEFPEGVPIYADVMRARLRRAKELANLCESAAPIARRFEDFVSLCAAKERSTGEPCRIIAR